MTISLLSRLEAIRPFTEDEAWTLFKIAALSEAAGWTLLIAGILVRHYGWPGRNIAVPITGQIHGTIFLAYFGVLLTVYSSLRWPRRKFLLAALAGVPPFGTLIFEQWAAWTRRNQRCRIHFRCSALTVISNNILD